MYDEFITMLLIEKKCQESTVFYDYFVEHANKEQFNQRYKELLDSFLNKYALNKTEKSEKND